MKYIDRITDNPIQTMTLTGNARQRIKLTMRYMPSQQSWFMDVVYNDFRVYGLQVVANVNLLRNYQNIIPFGFVCTTEQQIDPYRLDDFLTGFAKLYLMNKQDVINIEEAFFE